MATLSKIDSNVTGLRYAEEASLGVLPATPTWYALEPNSYNDFGGEITTVARNPINDSRQRQKGVVTDLDASGGTVQDLTQENLQDLFQGFFFADLRRKGEDSGPLVGGVAGVTFTPTQYTAANGADTFTIAAHGLATGDGPFHLVEGSGVLPTGLAENTEYWVIVVDANTIQLATTYANATASTPVAVDFTGDGTDDATRLFHRRDSVDGTNEYIYVNDESGYVVNGLVFVSGYGVAANNGLKRITAVASGRLTVAENLTDEAVAPAAGKSVVVGYRGAAGTLDIDASGNLPQLDSDSGPDFTTLGLVPGEWIYIGGDSASLAFATAANNGWARIRSITASAIVFDKTQGTMVTEASTTETVQLFFGRVLKNESDPTLITRRSYNIERSLGAPDDSSPSDIQGEYLVGSVPSQLVFNFNTADKVTVDMSFVSTNNEQRTAATGLKSGNRPTILAEDAFNTSSDFSRLKMVILDPADSNPSALFAYLTEFQITLNNNLTPNKAIGTLGAFEVTAGQFPVDGTATAYFSTVEAVQAVRNNSDVSLDFALVKSVTVDSATVKRGILVDLPLVTLGDGRLEVEQDQPITLPLSKQAAADRNFNHTMLMQFFDYLPSAADS